MLTPRLTLPSSSSSFWRNTKWLSSPTHRTPLIWHPVSSYFQKIKLRLKGYGLIPFRRSRPNRQECWTLTEKDFQEAFQTRGAWWARCLYAGEGWATSRVMAADGPYCEYSIMIFTVSARNILYTPLYNMYITILSPGFAQPIMFCLRNLSFHSGFIYTYAARLSIANVNSLVQRPYTGCVEFGLNLD
jgi:hypothetical protein